MKKQVHFVSGLLLTGLLAQPVTGQLITDEYWGGDPTHDYWNSDLIGDSNVFDLTGADVFIPQDRGGLEVRIYGNYFDNILSRSGLLYTEMGDLFISTDGLGHNLTGAASLDDYLGQPTKTEWEYGVRLGTYIDDANNILENQAVRNGTVHQFADRDTAPATYSSQIVTSYANPGYIYRSRQEVKIAQGTPEASGPTATWYIDTTGPSGFLSITLDNFNVGIYEKLGFHWTMTCANDVLEFEVGIPSEVVVPEPATVGLLGMGGLGLILLLRKRVKAAR